jgi:hypothetical protein
LDLAFSIDKRRGIGWRRKWRRENQPPKKIKKKKKKKKKVTVCELHTWWVVHTSAKVMEWRMGKSGGRRVVDPTTKTKTKYKGKKKYKGGAPLLSDTYWKVNQ